MANSGKKLTKEEIVDKNFESFQKLLPDLLRANFGRFALLRDGEVVEFFDSSRDALLFAERLYEDDNFSVQQVVNNSINLGYWSSHA